MRETHRLLLALADGRVLQALPHLNPAARQPVHRPKLMHQQKLFSPLHKDQGKGVCWNGVSSLGLRHVPRLKQARFPRDVVVVDVSLDRVDTFGADGAGGVCVAVANVVEREVEVQAVGGERQSASRALDVA
jgi:hypothetical protein